MKTCLVVDDAALDRKMVGLSAAKTGFAVSMAESGKEALALCNKSLPDLMLLDWEMQNMNGIEVLKQLRQLNGGDHVPVILCTSYEHPSFIGHAYVHGASGYITKPVTQDKLAAKLGELGML